VLPTGAPASLDADWQYMLLGAGALKSTVADLLKHARWEMDEQNPAVKMSHEPKFVLSDNFSVV